MPAGADFVCENKECEHHGKGLVVTAPWPMGEIDKIIDAPNVAKIKSFQNEIIKMKEEGREQVCITYPNIDDIDTVGYRVHRWCSNCPCLWTYDAMVEDENNTMEDTVEKSDIPEKCTKCDTELTDFNALIEEGIICPYCKEEMKMNTWFSNETTEEN